MSEKKLENKVSIVTGAASGIGRAIARTFLDNGAKVLAIDLPGQSLQEQFTDGEIEYLEIDITDSEAPRQIVDKCIDTFSQLDILINNAGICIAGEFEELTDEQWEKIIAVNVTSMFRLSRESIPYLKKGERARIINLGSIMSDMGGPSLSIYGMSKHAVAGLSKGMAVDLGKYQSCILH